MRSRNETLQLLAQLRPRNAAPRRPWYDFRNLTEGKTEVLIYDFIGFDPWMGGISAAEFARDLKAINTRKIVLRINSPGGDIFEGVAIRNALREHPAQIETHIDGLAASTASWVGLDAKRVIMAPHATMMIHEPWDIALGDAETFRKEAGVLDQLGDEIARMYVEKAGGETAAWRDLMRAETWYMDDAAVQSGLADEVAGGEPASADNRYDPAILRIYENTPEELLTDDPNTPTPTQPTPPYEAPSELIAATLRYQRDTNARRQGVAA